MEIVGVLADSITVSDDCMSAVVSLKESVMWHDGINFTSADVVQTISLIKENTASPYYECVKKIDEVKALEPLSLKMTFSQPFGQVVHSLYFPIVASHNNNLEDNIIGTGPYAYDSSAAAVSLNLKKHKSWHGGDAVSRDIVVSMVRDNDVATSAFNSGSVNVISSNSYDFFSSMPKDNPQMTQYPSLQYEFMAFNHKRDIFSSSAIISNL